MQTFLPPLGILICYHYAAYIPPQANTTTALKELYTTVNRQESAHPEATFIIAGDFNQASLKKVLSKYHQHIFCPMQGVNTLDHLYSTFKDSYKSLRRAPFGKSDASILMLPASKQQLKQTSPVMQSIQCWSSQSDSMLQDCFDCMDWNVFKDNNNISDYADTVTGYISKCIRDCVPTVTVDLTLTLSRSLG